MNRNGGAATWLPHRPLLVDLIKVDGHWRVDSTLVAMRVLGLD